MKIPHASYHRILSSMPLLCVDGVLRNASGKFLLVKRINEPLKGRWWVPGGRVLKGEKILTAFHRKMREELGIDVLEPRYIGLFESTRMRHSGVDGGYLHSLSVVIEAQVDCTSVQLDSQSSAWGFFNKLPALFKIQPQGMGLK